MFIDCAILKIQDIDENTEQISYIARCIHLTACMHACTYMTACDGVTGIYIYISIKTLQCEMSN